MSYSSLKDLYPQKSYTSGRSAQYKCGEQYQIQPSNVYQMPKMCPRGASGADYPPRYDTLQHGVSGIQPGYFNLAQSHPQAGCQSCKVSYGSRPCGGCFSCEQPKPPAPVPEPMPEPVKEGYCGCGM